jgi:hypothetical protein
MSRYDLMVILMFLPLGGCAAVRMEGERLELCQPWWQTVLAVGVGVALMGLGVPLVLGRWKPKGKPRVTGVISLLMGAIIAVLSAISIPYERLVVSPDEVLSTTGPFGEDRTEVHLSGIKKLVLYKGRRPRDHPQHSVGPTTYVEFVPAAGASTHVRMKEPKRTPAIAHLLKQAAKLGIEVEDQRSDYDPLRRLR